jgi:peptidoglycan/LPS O-acetylase OafA/YrhL
VDHFLRPETGGHAFEAFRISLTAVAAFALPMFFVLSGFLITGILLEAKEQPHYFRNFYMRRFLRIFPLYYGVLAILFLVHPGWGRTVGAGADPRWLWMYVANFEIARRNSWVYFDLSHFWSLCVEEQFYLLWPVVVLILRPRWLLALCGMLGIAAVATRFFLVEGASRDIAAYVLTPCQLDPIAAGAVLAIVVRKLPLDRLAPFARVSVALSLGFFLLSGWLTKPMMDGTVVVWRPLLSSFLFGGVILLSVGKRGTLRRFLGARPLTFLGKYSYGLYIYHLPFISLLLLRLPSTTAGSLSGSQFGGMVGRLVFALATSLLIAIASYELVEKRLLRLKVLFEE